MTQEFELLFTCGFFAKYQATRDLSCKGFINTFCRGALMDRRAHGPVPKKTGQQANWSDVPRLPTDLTQASAACVLGAHQSRTSRTPFAKQQS